MLQLANMHIKQKLMEDMKQAMRERDALRLSALRYLLAEIKNREIDDGELEEAQITNIISKQVKQIKEVLVDYEKAGKRDTITEENAKVAVLESYLPKAMDQAELEALIDEVIANAPEKVMGPIIAAVRQKVAGRADGALIAQLVKQKLAP